MVHFFFSLPSSCFLSYFFLGRELVFFLFFLVFLIAFFVEFLFSCFFYFLVFFYKFPPLNCWWFVQERLFIGTPGSYYWQGQTYSQNLWNRMDLVATEEGPETEDNTYLGRASLYLKCNLPMNHHVRKLVGRSVIISITGSYTSMHLSKYLFTFIYRPNVHQSSQLF